MWSKLPPAEPFALHVPLVQTILELQDFSVCSIRDIVRNIEQAGLLSYWYVRYVDSSWTEPLAGAPWLPGLHHDARDSKARDPLL